MTNEENIRIRALEIAAGLGRSDSADRIVANAEKFADFLRSRKHPSAPLATATSADPEELSPA